MEKITVKVCLGTTCFVMGGSNLQELNDLIPKKYGDKVEENEVLAYVHADTAEKADAAIEAIKEAYTFSNELLSKKRNVLDVI